MASCGKSATKAGPGGQFGVAKILAVENKKVLAVENKL